MVVELEVTQIVEEERGSAGDNEWMTSRTNLVSRMDTQSVTLNLPFPSLLNVASSRISLVTRIDT